MKILFYSDSVPIGGHELMSIRLANLLARTQKDYNISFLCPNTFFNKLDGNIVKINNDVKPRALNGSFGMLFIHDFFKIKKTLKLVNPDIVVVCQGTIELGIKAVIVSKLLKIPVVSYIPLVIDLNATGSKFFPNIRNFINGKLYLLADAYVTISNYHKLELGKRTTRDVRVLRNWVDCFLPVNDSDFNLKPDLKTWISAQKRNGQSILLIIGRIEFKHKQQDKFLEYVYNNLLNKNISILFVGTGSDQKRLSDVINDNRFENVYYAGKIENVEKLYPLVNGVCICSSFEGVPLVLLEAVNHSLPVFSFGFNAVYDYLPSCLIANDQDFYSLFKIINSYDFSVNKFDYSINYSEPIQSDIDGIFTLINDLNSKR